MDILRKELNEIYRSQHLDEEQLDNIEIERSKILIKNLVSIRESCAIITDASNDRCHLSGGSLARILGITDSFNINASFDSCDEDLIYDKMHPEDLVEKRMLEYEFFKAVDDMPNSKKTGYKATCRIRITDRDGQYIHIDNSTQILTTSPKGKIWLILCCYDLSPDQSPISGICPRIIDNLGGQITELQLSEKRRNILSDREKEILRLIQVGKPSKQIADTLGISIHTVNRHRQNILEKLSVGNSVEAITAATSMKLL